ncbi:hypothetical protein DPMN_035103 [Dreissena polymorpha]|uniref:Uncharacterized protein n=1 Tax=Dreissena polymorpha TaxID=45954 RepID=A0A9D4RLK5_DREPO|nr:hypothetical protein DPMN_035103 [Dreissena polymorpha]
MKNPHPLVAIYHWDKSSDDWNINGASRVLTRKNAPPHGGHVFQPIGIIFELVQDIIGFNLLTKFHEYRTINVGSRVYIKEKCPAPFCHVFQANVTYFKLIQYIIETNLLTKLLTRKNAPPPDIIGTDLLTKSHVDRTINVATRVLTRKNAPPCGGHVFQPIGIIFEILQDIIGINLLTKKNAPPLGSHVFQANVTIFKLIQDSFETNLLTKFH